MVSIVGKTFSSYSELKTWIKEYENRTSIQYFKSSSRSIEGARKRGIKRFLKSDLVYAEITYSCIHAGKHKSRSTGIRPNQSTYRQGCEAKIRLKPSSDGQFLEVVFCKEEHNHELTHFRPKQSLLEKTVLKSSKSRKPKSKDKSVTSTVASQKDPKNIEEEVSIDDEIATQRISELLSPSTPNTTIVTPSSPIVTTTPNINTPKNKDRVQMEENTSCAAASLNENLRLKREFMIDEHELRKKHMKIEHDLNVQIAEEKLKLLRKLNERISSGDVRLGISLDVLNV